MNQKLKELAFVGVDTHKDEHTACMSDCFGQPLGVFTVENRPDHMDGLLKEIDKAAKSQELLRIYPTPSGYKWMLFEGQIIFLVCYRI